MQKYSSDLDIPCIRIIHIMLIYSRTVTESKTPLQKGHVEKVLLNLEILCNAEYDKKLSF